VKGAATPAGRMGRKIKMVKMVDVQELPSLVGREIGVSEWILVDQERINGFAQLAGDHQWIHVDVERAQREIGGTIAHGFLTLSLMSVMSAQIMRVNGVKRGINYGLNKVRFTDVVPAGARIRMRMKLLAVEPKAGGMALTRQCTVEVEGKDRPALVAEWVGLIYT
jgi:acyl dehydratase